jgi:hypothetical protein
VVQRGNYIRRPLLVGARRRDTVRLGTEQLATVLMYTGLCDHVLQQHGDRPGLHQLQCTVAPGTD